MKARTPLLIAVGKDDPRVHPSQSLALYRSLKLLGQVPVRLVAYPFVIVVDRRGRLRMAEAAPRSSRIRSVVDAIIAEP